MPTLTKNPSTTTKNPTTNPATTTKTNPTTTPTTTTAIVPHSTPGTDAVRAMVFDVGGRGVVRLVQDSQCEAERVVAEVLGMGAVCSSEVVGHSVRRAAGFPTWVIMNYPECAVHALNLVEVVRWARQRVHSQASKVKTRFEALAVELNMSAPQLLPTLLEEVSRLFVEAGKPKFAKQFFGLARAVEREHCLPIDDARHRAAMTEFADYGAVGARELAAEARRLVEATPATNTTPVTNTTPTTTNTTPTTNTKDFDYFLCLNTSLARQGVPPYTAMLADARKVGTQAGLSAAQVDRRVCAGLLGSRGLLGASLGFWNKTATALGEYVRQQPEALPLLLIGLPEKMDAEEFFQLLSDVGALGMLYEDPEWLADFLTDFINSTAAREFDGFAHGTVDVDNAHLVAALDHVGVAMRGKEISADLSRVPLAIVDVLCKAQVSWRKQRVRPQLRLQQWLHPRTGGERSALSHAARDGFIGPRLAADLQSFFTQGGPELEVLAAYEGPRLLLRGEFDRLLAARREARGNIEQTRSYLRKYEGLSRRSLELLADSPAEVEELSSFDAAGELALALRRGFLTELSWPLFESEFLSRELADCFESFPAVSLVSGDTIVTVDGEKTLGTQRLAAAAELFPAAVHFVDGHITVTFDERDYRRFKLAKDSTATLTVCSTSGRYNPSSYSLPLPVVRFTSGGLLYKGTCETGTGNVLCTDPTGGAVFATQADDVLTRWDGDAFLPWEGSNAELFAALGLDEFGLDFSSVPEDAVLRPQHSVVIPVQPSTVDSPLGSTHNVHVSLVFDRGKERFIVSSLGTFQVPQDVRFVVQRPGGPVWAVAPGMLYDAPSHAPLARIDADDPRLRALWALPHAGWHQLRPRCPELSAWLRSCTTEQAEDLLAADGEAEIAALLGVPERQLVGTIATLVREVKQLAAAFADNQR